MIMLTIEQQQQPPTTTTTTITVVLIILQAVVKTAIILGRRFDSIDADSSTATIVKNNYH